jgi:hypothetical protein
MKSRLLFLLFLALLVPQSAFAWTSTWTEVLQVWTGATNDRFLVKLAATLADSDNCGSNDDTVILVPTDAQYEHDRKIIMAAFLAGKQVKFALSGCDNGYMKVTQTFICVDGTSCGQ